MEKMTSLRDAMIDPNNQTDANETAPLISVTRTITSTPPSTLRISSPNGASTQSIVHPVASTSSSNINERATAIERISGDAVVVMKLPAKLPTIGRPKGSGQTVIGSKRKVDKKAIDESTPPKKKFIDLSDSEQSLTLIQWLTNKSKAEIQKKKVTYSDIIQDPMIFNRLRNDSINLEGTKKFLDNKCYKYLMDEVERLNNNEYWACAKCNRNLNNIQLMCNKCLDWFHLSCTEYKSAALPKNFTYYCSSCKV